jgi:hypothetical protein
MYLCTFEFWRLQVAMLRSANLPNMEEGRARIALEVSAATKNFRRTRNSWCYLAKLLHERVLYIFVQSKSKNLN